MAKDKAQAKEGEAKKGGMLKKLIMLVVVLALVGVGVFGGMVMGEKQAQSGVEDGSDGVGNEVVSDATSDGHGGGESKPKDDGHGGGEGGEGGHGKGDGSVKLSDLIFDLGQIQVNLRGTTRRLRVLQTTIQDAATSVQTRSDIEDHQIPQKDALIQLLSNKSHEDIDRPSGIDRLKREMYARFEGLLSPHVFKDIYITQLIVG
jgi:flagellar basal body-associated protein FliL